MKTAHVIEPCPVLARGQVSHMTALDGSLLTLLPIERPQHRYWTSLFFFGTSEHSKSILLGSQMSRSKQVASELGAVAGNGRASWVSVPLGLGLRAFNNVNKRATRAMLKLLAARSPYRLDFKRVGEGEGGWSIPTALLKDNGVAYCVGVGMNASFDQQLATDYNMRVYSIDPTPVAVKHMDTLVRDRDRHRFIPIGVWNANTTLRLYAPMSASSNLSVRDIHGTGRYIELPVKTLNTIMKEQGHAHLDLLKIDIEGSWFEVISDVCQSKVNISILCAEFDTPTSPRKAQRAISLLKRAGFAFVHADKENVIFVQKSLLASRT